MARFQDRSEAGRQLAAALRDLAARDPIVIALPRGGVPVGYEVARALRAPLDVWVVRKIGVPWQPELALGAVAEGGVVQLSEEMVDELGLSRAELSQAVESKQREVAERIQRFRAGRVRPKLSGRTVILVDDGIATGSTMLAAIRALRRQNPAELVLAVPVAAAQSLRELRPEVDEVVALLAPRDLTAIGLWYDVFEQVPDNEVVRLLQRAAAEQAERAEQERAATGGA